LQPYAKQSRIIRTPRLKIDAKYLNEKTYPARAEDEDDDEHEDDYGIRGHAQPFRTTPARRYANTSLDSGS
jgi:hypothetical protein